MINNIVHVNYHDHHVHISRDTVTDAVVIFKYNSSRCDFAVFAVTEWDQASDYILTNLPEGSWAFIMDNDEADPNQ